MPGGVQVQLCDACGDERRRVVCEIHTTGLASLGLAKGSRSSSATSRPAIAARELTIPLIVNLVSAGEAAATGPTPG